MDSYLSMLRGRGVARTMFSQMVARFPTGMIPLGFLIHLHQIFGSYGSAGLVLSAAATGQAVAGPISSRMLGRFGTRRVLIITSLVTAAAIVVIALATMPLWGYLVTGALAGLSSPPVQPAVRAMYPKLVDQAHLPRLFSLDASAQELIWIGGPVLITLLSKEISSQVGLLACAFILLGGGVWFIASPYLAEVNITRSTLRIGVVLLNPPVLLATMTGLLLIGSVAALETGVVARFGDGGIQAGIVLALSAVSSLVGGLVLGHLPIGGWTLAKRLAIVAAGAVCGYFAIGMFTTSAAVIVLGFGIAPALAIMFTFVSVSVSLNHSVEAYGWLGTGHLVGGAIGSAVGGFMIDAQGADGGFLASVIIAGAAVLVASIFRRSQPEISGSALVKAAD